MKQFSKQFLSVMLLLSTAAIWSADRSHHDGRSDRSCTTRSISTSLSCNDCDTSARSNRSERKTDCKECEKCATSFFLPRPQGLNSAVLFNPFYYGCDGGQINDACGYVQLGYRFQQTWKDKHIAECLFGSDKLIFTGSNVEDREKGQLLADNFGLSPNLHARLDFEPRIQNNIIDFMSRYELGNWSDCLECAYFGVNASLAVSRWDLNACDPSQTVSGNDAFNNFPPGYMSKDPIASSDVPSALSGVFTFGDMQEEWKWGRFVLERDNELQTKTGLANLDLFLGYDFLRCDTYHFGAFVKASAPTGTRPDARYVFSPIVGNGHHWEVGGGIDAHWALWSCDDQCIAVYLNGAATHLFKDTQWRSFDFRDSKSQSGCLSRYLLLKEFDNDGSYFRLVPGINWTTRKVKSSFDVQGDAALRFVYYNCGWALGVGYNVYGRSKEKLCGECNDKCSSVRDRHFGIKGTAGVAALAIDDPAVTVPLETTESQARIFDGAAIDNPKDVPGFVDYLGDEAVNSDPAKEVFCRRDLKLVGVPSQISHKVFAHIDYQWEDCDCWQPYAGVYGECEFAQKGDCKVCTPNMWAVSVRVGASF